MHAYTSAQSKALDLAAQSQGIGGFDLMLRAGFSAFQQIGAHYDAARSLLVLAGKGNNGGDAWVVAGAALAAGWQVYLWQVTGDPEDFRGEAAAARDWALARGVGDVLVDREAIDSLGLDAPEHAQSMIVVDGLLGTGLQGAPRPDIANAIDWLNSKELNVVALDVPSGLNADNGAAAGALVRSALTVTFIGMKLGLLTGRGPGCAGQVVLENLGVDVQRLIQTVATGDLTQGCPVLARPVDPLPPRNPLAYKNQFGHVAVLAGDHGGGGAALLAAEAALRIGAGLVSVGTRALHVPGFLARRPELMAQDVDSKLAALQLLEPASVLLVGPGLGQSAWGEQLYAAAVDTMNRSSESGQHAISAAIVDADALNLVSAGAPLPQRSVITPHPGEAARLLGCVVKDIEADPVGAVCELAVRFNCIAVLKGPGSLVADCSGLKYVCALGNPGMATAGMGDVLAGIVAGVVAQQTLDTYWVARAVQFHAAAGDLAAATLSEHSLLAADVIDQLPTLMRGEN